MHLYKWINNKSRKYEMRVCLNVLPNSYINPIKLKQDFVKYNLRFSHYKCLTHTAVDVHFNYKLIFFSEFGR